MPHLGPSATLKKSALITRKQLGCLTGGKIDNFQHENILGVGTPIHCYGGSAIGIKKGVIHHMCLKEVRNHPIPKSSNEDFLVYKEPEKGSTDHRMNALRQAYQHPPIPIFWEPGPQNGKSTAIDTIAKGVAYIGHWRVTRVDDLRDNPVMIKGRQRIALICLKFHDYNQRWSDIIDLCHDKACSEIKKINFQHLPQDESFGSIISSNSCDHGAPSEESNHGAAASPKAGILGGDGGACDANLISGTKGKLQKPIQSIKFEAIPAVEVGKTEDNPVVIDSDDEDGPKANCILESSESIEPHSLKDLQEVVAAIINASDRNTIRVKDVCQLVAKHFRLSKISEQTKLLIIEHSKHVLKQLVDESRRHENATCQSIQPEQMNRMAKCISNNEMAGSLCKKRSICHDTSSMANYDVKKYRTEKINLAKDSSAHQQIEQSRQSDFSTRKATKREPGLEVYDGMTEDSAIVIDSDYDNASVVDPILKYEQTTLGHSEVGGYDGVQQVTKKKTDDTLLQDSITTKDQHTHHMAKTSRSDVLPHRFLYFKVDIIGLDLNVGGIVIPADKVITFQDLRNDIVRHKQHVLPFSSFCFDLGNDFVIQPSQETLEVKEHAIAKGNQDGSLQNPFRVFIRESTHKNDVVDV